MENSPTVSSPAHFLIPRAVSILSLVVIAVVLYLAGYAPMVIALAVVGCFAYSLCFTWVQGWIAGARGRVPAPKSEKYAAVYFLIVIGVMALSLFLLPRGEILVLMLIWFLGFILAATVAQWFFGDSVDDSVKDVVVYDPDVPTN